MNWCSIHGREATGDNRCDPKLGGIMFPCTVTALPPIYVFGCVRRPSLAMPPLLAAGLNPTLHVGTDYNPPRGTTFQPPYNRALDHKLTAHYRVFLGHRDMAYRFLCEHPEAPYALMMEDDGVPNCADFVSAIADSLNYAIRNSLPTLCLHARSIRPRLFTPSGKIPDRTVFKLNPQTRRTPNIMGGTHHLYGFTLAYLISRAVANSFTEGPAWTGIPVDCYLPDTYGTELLQPSPFNHDRSQGSLVDGKYRKPKHV